MQICTKKNFNLAYFVQVSTPLVKCEVGLEYEEDDMAGEESE